MKDRLLLQHSLFFILLHRTSMSEYTIAIPDIFNVHGVPQIGNSSKAHTDLDEQQAVYDIMSATGNAWAAVIPDVCRGRWHGIECMLDSENVFHVTSLSFGALSDDTAFPTCDGNATLSPAVLRLPYLRNLFFYRCLNSNPQPIPKFIGKLGTGLRSIVLRDNGHVGSIPSALGNLTSLRLLDLHGNSIFFSIPSSFSNLINLQKLDLSSNQLNGGIPRINSPSLRILNLNRNLLHGQIPSSLSDCESLIKIDLSRNRIVGSIPNSLNDLRNLILLDLSHNSLSGGLPCSTKNGYPSLQALVLKNNPMISAIIPEDCFEGMKDLNTLILSNMGLKGPIPESMSEMQSLRVLHLDGNALNGSIPENFNRLHNLSELNLERNKLTGMIPFGRRMIERMGRKMTMSNNSGLCFEMRDRDNEYLKSMMGISYCVH